MQITILLKRIMLLVIPSGLIIFLVLIINFILINSIQGSTELLIENVITTPTPTPTPVPIQAQVKVGLPMQLNIPAINVDAKVISVGLTSKGAMGVPKNPAEVAWYNLGSRPGAIGSAVIAGHYDWKYNKKAVFYNLNKLKIGDKMFIEDDYGVTITFIVRDIKVYNKNAVVPEIFNSTDGKSHLNLITCKGAWNKSAKSYADRLVVFAEKE